LGGVKVWGTKDKAMVVLRNVARGNLAKYAKWRGFWGSAECKMQNDGRNGAEIHRLPGAKNYLHN